MSRRLSPHAGQQPTPGPSMADPQPQQQGGDTQLSTEEKLAATERHLQALYGQIAQLQKNQFDPQQLAQIMAAALVAQQSKSCPEPTASPYPSIRPSLPTPASFSGERRDYRTWKLAMQSKLRVDSRAIGDESAQVAYVAACLSGQVQRIISAWLSTDDKVTVDQIFARLDEIYEDRNLQRRAVAMLHSLRQKETQAFPSFHVAFQQAIADAGAEVWGEMSHYNLLRNALSLNTLKALKVRGMPQTYVELVEACQDMAAVDEEIAAKEKKIGLARPNSYQTGRPAYIQPGPSHTQPGPSRRPTYEAMDWEPTTNTSRTNTYNGNPEGRWSDRPEDARLNGKRAEWVPGWVVRKRMAEGKCVRCNRAGCTQRTCPLARAIDPNRRQGPTPPSRQLTTTRQAEVVEIDDDETEKGQLL